MATEMQGVRSWMLRRCESELAALPSATPEMLLLISASVIGKWRYDYSGRALPDFFVPPEAELVGKCALTDREVTRLARAAVAREKDAKPFRYGPPGKDDKQLPLDRTTGLRQVSLKAVG